MIPWYAPTTLNAWSRRLLSARTIILVLALAAFAITELRFDWVEETVGTFLVTTNSGRPQSGTIWEQGRMTDSARQTLAQYASERQNVQREVRQAGSLGQVIASIGAEKGVMISAEHFLALYLKLPPVLYQEVVSPYTLLAYDSAGKWQRTYLERQDKQLLIHLLDSQNQVVHRLSIGAVLLGHIERGEIAIRSGLDQLSDFAAHIYPAERFFAALNSMTEEGQRSVVAHPEDLLRVSGRIRRIGISDTDIGNAVDLGFEVEDLDGPKVILVQGDRDDVRRLQRLLAYGSGSMWPWKGEVRP